jgi:hypothetical protein
METRMKNRILIVLILLISCTKDYTGCIAEGSKISTPNGDVKIEKLKVGDIIYSVNPSTGERIKAVIKKIVSKNSIYYIVNSHMGNVVEATGEHLFLVSEEVKYYQIKELLKKSKRLQILQNDALQSTNINITPAKNKKKVYDLTVNSQFKNFIANGFVVHNKSFAELYAEINDFKVDTVFTDSVSFNWTVPDWPGKGAPNTYMISIVNEVDSLNINAWVEYKIDTINLEIGDKVTYGIKLLNQGSYYLAKIRSSVKHTNWSPYSEKINFKTKD